MAKSEKATVPKKKTQPISQAAKEKSKPLAAAEGGADVNLEQIENQKPRAEIQTMAQSHKAAQTDQVFNDQAAGLGATGNEKLEDEVVTDGKKETEMGLMTISAWAMENRLASWQTALVARQNGWTEDKKVSDEDFKSALDKIMNRPQGGGYGRRN